MIALGQRDTDNINRMITITNEFHIYVRVIWSRTNSVNLITLTK